MAIFNHQIYSKELLTEAITPEECTEALDKGCHAAIDVEVVYHD